jgi:alanine dehydrogenase
MKLGHELMYVSRADLKTIGPTQAEMQGAIEAVFKARADGRALVKPKMVLPMDGGVTFFALGSASRDPAYGCVKWTGLAPDNHEHDVPHLNSIVILNDLKTGAPLAIIDGNWISQERSAAVTAVAAKYLARRDATSVAFIACGIQARSNLSAILAAGFPISHVYAYSEPHDTATAFAADMASSKYQITVTKTAKEAVESADIVISSVPHTSGLRPFLDPAWLRPGAYASLVDLGRSWLCDKVEALDCVATDDYEQSRSKDQLSRMPYQGRFDAELAELVSGKKKGRSSATGRTIFIHPGLAIGDLAVASLIYERARAKKAGTIWAR